MAISYSELNEAIILGISLCAYFIVHSLLASMTVKSWVKRRFTQFMPAYRLVYNALSIVLLIPVLLYLFTHQGTLLWKWDGASAWLIQALNIAAVIAFLLSLGIYNSKSFLGLVQWKQHQINATDSDRFEISLLHRYVRHPWYFLIIVILWTRDYYTNTLLAYTLMTLYFIIGSRLEENKLIVRFGDVYAQYKKCVPGLCPLPWRNLSRDKARLLTETASDQDTNG